MSLDKEFRTDFEDQYIPLCQAVVRRVQKLIRSLDLSSVDQCQLQQTQKQLEEKQVVFSIFGFNNSGKSTLLNTIILDVLLPINATNETSVKISIRHDERKHQGPCPFAETKPSCRECPVLVYDDGREQRGAKPIEEALRVVNQHFRQLSITGGGACPVENVKEYTIFANVPVLSGVPSPWAVCLVDSPGFGDAVAGINRLAETALKTSSAYLYVLDYNHLQNLSDTECFKLMHEKDKDIFNKECCRLLIVVTKFDRFYREATFGQISEGQIKEIVCTRVKEATGIEEFPEENVIAVSGEWALLARQLQARLECVEQRDVRKLRREARKRLEDYVDEHPKGQAEDNSDFIDGLPSQVIARKLEEASGIKKLEKRIQMMTAHCFTIWVKTTSRSCLNYLEQAGNVIETMVESLTRTVNALEKKYEQFVHCYAKMKRQLGEWRRVTKAGKGSSVYHEFEEKFMEDIQRPAESSIQVANKLVEAFKEKCVEKAKSGHYTVCNFQDDVKTFLESASKELEQSLSIARFEHMHALKTNKAQAIGKQDALMRKYALKVCHGEEDSDSDSEISEETTSALEETLHDVLEQNPPRLHELQDQVGLTSFSASIWTRIRMFLSTMFTRRNAESFLNRQSLTRRDLTGPLEQLEEVITRGCKEYLREIQPRIVEHFYNDYCMRVQMCGRSLRTEFEERLNLRVAEMEKLKEVVDKNKGEARRLTDNQIHIETLKEHFVTKVREFHRQHDI